MALAVDRRVRWFAGLVIGLAVACEIMVIGPISARSVNPTRTFGPYLATDIFAGSPPWNEFWSYWVGPLVGGAIAALSYHVIAQPERDEAAAQAGQRQGTAGTIEGRRVVTEDEQTTEANTQPKGDIPMAGNKAVAYIEPGKVEVQAIDYPKLEVQDGPGVTRRTSAARPPRRDPEDRRDQHLRLRPAHGPRPHHRARGLILGHEITGEVIEAGPGRRVHQGGRPRARCPSTSPAGAAGTARRARPGSA